MKKLKEKIRDNFNFPLPNFQIIIPAHDFERREIVDYFKNKNNSEITLDIINKFKGDKASILPLLPLDYYLYFFKSFLVLSMDYCENIDLLCDSVIYSLHLHFSDETVNALAHERMSFINDEEICILFEYLRYMEDKYPNIVDSWEIDEAKKSLQSLLHQL